MGLVGEGVEGAGSPLPLRKRKFTITDVVSVKKRSSEARDSAEASCVIGQTSTSLNSSSQAGNSKRRKIASATSTSDIQVCF